MNEQELAVVEYLKSIGVKYNPIITSVNNTSSDGWERDSFRIMFDRDDKSFDTEYHSGTGHRMVSPVYSIGMKIKAHLKAIDVKPVADVTFKRAGDKYNHYKPGDTVSMVTVVPNQASVLYSLLMDGDSGYELFDDFCDNYGYDNDSIKAHNIYEACQKIAGKMRKFFSTEERNKLQELLEDY